METPEEKPEPSGSRESLHTARLAYGRPLKAGDIIPLSAFAGTAIEQVLRTGRPLIRNFGPPEEEKKSDQV